MPEKIVSVNLDANESMFFARELEYVKSRAYDIVYPQFRALELIPISSEVDSGADSITYDQYDSVGLAKIIANYADDLPRSDVKGQQFTSAVRGIGGSYGYSVQDIRKAQMTGKPLQQRRANSARRANDELTNKLAWAGDSSYNIVGLLYHPNVTKSVVQAGATSGNYTWAPGQKTNDEIVTDMMDAIDDVRTLTKGVENPDTLLIPLARWGRISGTRMAAGTDTTILQFFRQNRPNVNVPEGGIPELDGVNPSPTGIAAARNVMIAYERNVDKLSLEIPQPFEQFPAQERNLEFIVPTHSRVGGVIVYYPLSVNIVEYI